MANLSDTNRARVWRGVQRYWSENWEPVSISKSELRAAINATDNWIENNQANYNNALPAAAKNNLSLPQKTLLFCAVAMARVSIAALRRLFGEVD